MPSASNHTFYPPNQQSWSTSATMKNSILFTTFFTAALVSAAPPGGKRTEYAWSPALAGYYEKVALQMREAKASGAAPPSCDLAGAAPPLAPTPLPTPDGLVLAHVAVGRGVQVSPNPPNTLNPTTPPLKS